VVKICEAGLRVGNTSLVSLGKPDMGVYVCKHADVVSLAPLGASDSGHILVFKVVKVRCMHLLAKLLWITVIVQYSSCKVKA